MKLTAIILAATLAATSATAQDIPYDPPNGWHLAFTSPEYNQWVILEGKRLFIRLLTPQGQPLNNFYVDFACASQSASVSSQNDWTPIRDYAPGSIARVQLEIACQ